MAATKARVLLLLSLLTLVLSQDPLYKFASSTKPWRSTTQRRSFYQHDYNQHFLDQEEWMTDKRSRQYRVDLKSRKPNSLSITSRIVYFNLAAYVLQVFRPDFTQWGMKLSDKILRGQELHRLVTPIFLHGGIFHLFTNMYSLQQVGNDLERIFGPGRFIAAYAVSGLAGNLVSAIQSPNPSLGASGAVFGVVSAYFVFLTRNEWLLGGVGERMSSAIAQTLLANVVLGALNPVIDTWAHLGGAIGGGLYAWYFGPRLYLSELPSGGRLLIDRPIIRLPRPIEVIPERIYDSIQHTFGRLQVGKTLYQHDLSDKPWRPEKRYRPPTGNRSIKPGQVD